MSSIGDMGGWVSVEVEERSLKSTTVGHQRLWEVRWSEGSLALAMSDRGSRGAVPIRRESGPACRHSKSWKAKIGPALNHGLRTPQ